QSVSVGGRPYQIVGVLQPQGKIFGASRDNLIYIPYSTYQKNFGAHSSLIVFVKTPTANQLEEAEDQVRTIMRNRRGKTFGDDSDEGLTLETSDVFIDLYGKATSNIYIVTYLVAGVSLFVGGIVVMNIMLASVHERTTATCTHNSISRRA